MYISGKTRPLSSLSGLDKGKILAALFVGLNVLDGILTQELVARGHYELNPIISGIIGSSWAFWVFKIGLAAALVFVFFAFRSKFPVQSHRIMSILVIAMAVVCTWNGSIML